MTISGDGDAEYQPIELLLPLWPGAPWPAPIWKQRGNPLLDSLEDAVRDHLPKVLESARKLRADGWHIRLTIVGLGVRPPGRVERTIGDHYEGVECPWHPYFRRLGLPVFPIDCGRAPRGLREILAATGEATDRVWYERSMRHMLQTGEDPNNPGRPIPPPEVLAGAMKSQMRLEAKYGQKSLQEPCDDAFETGFLCGKLSCLRWILGEPWDSLYT